MFLFVFSNIIVNVLRERRLCLRVFVGGYRGGDEGDASVPTLLHTTPAPTDLPGQGVGSGLVGREGSLDERKGVGSDVTTSAISLHGSS